MNAPAAIALRLSQGGAVTLARAPEGFDAFVVADYVRMLAREAESRAVALTFVARDGMRAQTLHRRARLRRAGNRGALSAGLGLPAL